MRVYSCSNLWTSYLVKEIVFGDWEEIVEIIENLFVLGLLSRDFGTSRAIHYPLDHDNSECQERHRKTHGEIR